MSKRSSPPWSRILLLALGVLTGAAAGFLLTFALAPLGLSGLLLALAGLILSVWLHAILHEGGHLVCGLLSGYRFLSFRVGSFTLMRQDGRLYLRRFHVPGTGGQCLLEPPEREDYPFRLYNLGGGLSNLLFSLLALIAALLLPVPWRALALVFGGIGVLIALTNLAPMRVGGVANDGFNLLLLSRSTQARWAFALQLRCNARLQAGVPMEQMPASWFQMPADADLSDALVAAAAAFFPARHLAAGDLEGAETAFRLLLDQSTGLLDVQRHDLTCDLLTCSLLLGRPVEELAPRRTPEFLKYCKATRAYYPSTSRLEFLWALLADRDPDAAQRALTQFARCAPRWPYPATLDTERRLLELGRARGVELGVALPAG